VTTDRHDGEWEFMHWSGARRSRFGRDGECSQGSLEGESRGCAKPGFICNHMPDYEFTFEEHLWHELSLLSSEEEFSVDWDKWSACIRKARV